MRSTVRDQQRQQRNGTHAKTLLRGVGPDGAGAPGVEHGFAHLKNRRVLGTVRTDPAWVTATTCAQTTGSAVLDSA
ncbi:hypothetical protein [Streptomyces sp. NBC_01429]|uniref:hypothetical protein n=1 Tax=Streptomyces sp. NBC_01429 TaxID=2903862 RepID=UPI002E283F10|nr:hypothetical protein [Streptomyces sp. NBC_01429]